MKLIGFTGAGGTGKTTIANKFDISVPSNVDIIRKIIYGKTAKYGDLKKVEFISFQNLILCAQIHSELVYEDKYCNEKGYIPVERSSIDYAAYMLHLKDEDIDTYRLWKDKVDTYVDTCIKHANKNYDCLVYFPIDKFLAKDNPKSSKERNLISAKITDKYIQDLIKKVNIPVLTLKESDETLRYTEIIKYLKTAK